MEEKSKSARNLAIAGAVLLAIGLLVPDPVPFIDELLVNGSGVGCLVGAAVKALGSCKGQ